MNTFDNYCAKANKSIKYSDNKNTRDVAMCQIVTGLTYSILALACAIKEKGSDSPTDLEKENKKLRKIANKALDDKNRLLDERLKMIEAKESLDS